jgi:hypothetical protein
MKYEAGEVTADTLMHAFEKLVGWCENQIRSVPDGTRLS